MGNSTFTSSTTGCGRVQVRLVTGRPRRWRLRSLGGSEFGVRAHDLGGG